MRIAEHPSLPQPVVEPGGISAEDNAAASGSSDFQALIDEMTGSGQDNAGGPSARPRAEKPASSLPMSMLVAELTFDGAADESDQKLQGAVDTPMVPMPCAAPLPAETANGAKPFDESGSGETTMHDIAAALAADVICQPASDASEQSSGAFAAAFAPPGLPASGTPESNQSGSTAAASGSGIDHGGPPQGASTGKGAMLRAAMQQSRPVPESAPAPTTAVADDVTGTNRTDTAPGGPVEQPTMTPPAGDAVEAATGSIAGAGPVETMVPPGAKGAFDVRLPSGQAQPNAAESAESGAAPSPGPIETPTEVHFSAGAAPGNASRESYAANSIPAETPESTVADQPTNAPAVEAQNFSGQAAREYPTLVQDANAESVPAQSRHDGAVNAGDDPAAADSASSTQEASKTTNPAAIAVDPTDDTAAGFPQSTEPSTRIGSRLAPNTIQARQSAVARIQETEQAQRAIESPVPAAQAFKSGGIPGEITIAAHQQRTADGAVDPSTAKPEEHATEPTAVSCSKSSGDQAMNTPGNSKPVESVESKANSPQQSSGMQVEKAIGESFKPLRAGMGEGKQIVHQESPGSASPIDDKSAAMPKAPLPAAARPGEFVFELAGKIQSMVKGGEGEVRIQLRPEHLGNIQIKAEGGAAGIIARISAESAGVKQFLENNLHSLQQSLQDQGLKVERIDVVVQEGLDPRHAGEHQQPSGSSGNGHQESNAHAGGTGARSSSAISGDDLVVDSPTAFALGPNTTFHTIA